MPTKMPAAARKKPAAPAKRAAARRTVRPRAARMDPAVRRNLILDKAAALVLSRGLTACSLEDVAHEAGVSKALVYTYFPNRGSLYGALLEREFEHMRRHDVARDQAGDWHDPGHPIDDVLEAGVHRYLAYLAERGGLFRTLAGDAGVSGQVREALRAGQDVNMRFWTERTIAAYGLPYDLSRVGVIMTSYALEGAQGSIRAGKIDIDRLADFWTTFVRAGWKATGKKFGRAPKPPKRSRRPKTS